MPSGGNFPLTKLVFQSAMSSDRNVPRVSSIGTLPMVNPGCPRLAKGGTEKCEVGLDNAAPDMDIVACRWLSPPSLFRGTAVEAPSWSESGGYMRRRVQIMHAFLTVVAAWIAAATYSSRGFASEPDRPHAQVDLLANVSEVVAGGSFDVGVRFRIEEGWHIYWLNAGDAGLPPRVSWAIPEGFTLSELHFPVPKKHVAGGDIVTNVLKGEPVLLAEARAPAAIDGPSIRFAADIHYLICNTQCLREDAKVELSLPVRTSVGKPAPANEDVFAAARRALPKGSSRFLTVGVTVSDDSFASGQHFDLNVVLDIGREFHIQSDRPLNPAFIATELYLEPVNGMGFDPPQFPPAKVRSLPVVGKVSEFAGETRIRVPVKVYEAPTVEPIRFAGVVKYQACNESGNCFSPEAVAFTYLVSPDHAPAPVVKAGDSAGPTTGSATGSSLETGPAVAALAGASEKAPTDKAALPSVAVPAEEAGSGEAVNWTDWLRQFGLGGLLLGCFLYGLAINLTPCVLPLLSIKVLGFVQQAHESRARTAVLGFSFGLGAMIFFVVLGLLAAAGTNILQFPSAVIALGAVVVAMALSMLGVWTLQPPAAATSLDARIQQEGVLASFGKGMLAPVLGFACTGPFMAAAYGWAVQQPRGIAIVAFLVMGLGMATPYIVLGFNPRWLSFLPKPGAWMITFERIMGFLLLAMVVWLINPLTTQIGAVGLQWTFVFLIGVAMACWVWGQVNWTMSDGRRFALRMLSIAVVAISGAIVYGYAYPLGPALARQKMALETKYAGGSGGQGDDWSNGVPWQRWSPDAVHDAVCAGKTVFVDFTAAYCTQCKVNKKLVIETADVRSKMRALDVVPFQADFTIPDPKIAEELQRHGAAAVPLNLIYTPGKPAEPVVLPTALSKSALLGTLEKAGPSRMLLAAAPGCDA